MLNNPGKYGALGEKNFQLFSLGSLVAMIGRQMLTVAIGWDIYERTGSALALGYIGLMQLLPVILLTLPAGHVVDSYDRKKVLILSQVLNGVATAGLVLLSLTHGSVTAMYACLVLVGIGRAFHSPANAALLPQIVSEGNFTNAVTWSSILFQAAAILGPAIGGVLLAVFKSATPVYLMDFLCGSLFWVMLLFIKARPLELPRRAVSFRSLVSGLEFVWNTKMILAAITLDMFAVLFGGAVALLPVYAKDILHVGPSGLGWLQTAPSLGAILVGLLLARMPAFRNSGKWLLWCVIGFGISTIVFGLSQHFWLSFGALMLSGAFDNVSVVIRQALVQLRTPDEMRGRVSAINYVFIGTSNELGGFESGLAAHYFGPVFSVVFGGIATVFTVIMTGLIWPELRKLDRLEAEKPSPAEPKGVTA
ncbi:MAG: transporter [Vampirovibrio sp.]|jgi:MFS family permease|nr:transporter [Vampirovibrio sp.]